MNLILDGQRYVAKCSFLERHIPKSAGFHWDATKKQWFSTNRIDALKLASYGDAECRIKLLGPSRGTQAVQRMPPVCPDVDLSASYATDSDIPIPHPPGLEYMPFQRAGIAFAMERKHVLIGDEMGLGKTVQAVGIINADESIKRVLVVCPASLKINWQRELERWLVRDFDIGIAVGKNWPHFSDIVICNYDILHNHPGIILLLEWDLLIADECHYLKDPNSRRSRHVFGFGQRRADGTLPDGFVFPIRARRRVFLTGTPIVNRPVELWPIIHSLAPEQFPSYAEYTRRYCGAVKGIVGSEKGHSNLAESHMRLRSIMIRRRKEDVLKDLPPKRRQIVELPADGCEAEILAELQEWEAREKRLVALQHAVKRAKMTNNQGSYAEAVRTLKKAQGEEFQAMATVRRETGIRKLPMVLTHIEQSLEDGGKIVCFANHKEVIRQIEERFGLKRSCRVDGSVPVGAKRQAQVDRFMEDPECMLFIGNIQAAGVGLTLTVSSHVIFAELSWVPGELTQAEDRCHRHGQRDNVLVQHLVLEGSIDARMARVIVSKQNVIDQTMDGGAR